MKTSAFHISLFHINNWWKIVGAIGGSICLAYAIKTWQKPIILFANFVLG